MTQRLLLLVSLSVILISCSWSLFHPSLFYVHDFVHAARVAEMGRGIVDGQFPVRWSANFGYGYGMPLFEFYPPLPYYFGAVLWLLHVPIAVVVKLLFFIPSVVTVIAAYKLARVWFSRPIAVVATAAITLAPYRAVNLFVRGAVAEAWGMSFFILVLLGITWVVQRRKYASLLYLIAVIGLVLSHNLTTLIVLPVLFIWVLVSIMSETLRNEHSSRSFLARWWSTARHSLLVLSLLSLMAIGLTTFYWLPALSEKQFTQLNSTILSGYFDYRIHFVSFWQFFKPFWGYGGSSWGINDDMSFFLGYGQIIGTCISVFMVLGSLWSRSRRILMISRQRLVLTVACVVSLGFALFLAIQRSSVIWEFVPVLHSLQFPWRFLSVASTMIGLLSVIWITFFASKHHWPLVFSLLLFGLLLHNVAYFQPTRYLDDDSELYYVDSGRIRAEMSKTLPDFLPIQLSAKIPPTSLAVCNGGSVCDITKIIQQKSTDTNVMMSLGDRSEVILATAAYPGWQVTVDGQPQFPSVSSDGLVSVSVDKGEHIIRWYLGSTPVRSAADVISLISLTVLLLMILFRHQQVVNQVIFASSSRRDYKPYLE